jgi:hypothetical protein
MMPPFSLADKYGCHFKPQTNSPSRGPVGGALYFYVIDGTWNFTDTVNRIFTIDDIVVFNVADMVKKVSDAATKLGGKIENLFIAGHGCSGYQSIGAERDYDDTGSVSLQYDDTTGQLRGAAGSQLAKLAPLFSRSAIVTLGGCQVASDPDGPDLLRAVSQALGGIYVQGGKDTQRPLLPGMEGPILRCNPNACTIVSKGLWWGSPGGGGIN